MSKDASFIADAVEAIHRRIPAQMLGERCSAVRQLFTMKVDPERGEEVWSVYLCGEWMASAWGDRLAQGIIDYFCDCYFQKHCGLF